MIKCKILGEYSYFVECARKYSKKYEDFSTAIDKAVEECIEKGILKDLLLKYSVEVKNMLLTEFDEEKDWAIIAKGHEEIGYEKGIEEGKKEGMKNIINIMLSNGTSKETILKQMNISNEEYEKLVN